MTAEELFTSLVPLIAPAIEERWGRYNGCILATRVAVDVARYFGIIARPLAVRAIVCNSEFLLGVERGETTVEEMAAHDGYAVGVGFGRDPITGLIGCDSAHMAKRHNAWNGHLIVTAEGIFADFSIQQAERPQRSIITGPGIIGLLPDKQAWTVELEGGAMVQYRCIHEKTFRTAPDWAKASNRAQIVAKLICHLNGG
jgi:hypothetical protein